MAFAGPSMNGTCALIQMISWNVWLYHTALSEPVLDNVHYWIGSAKLNINIDYIRKLIEDVLHMGPIQTSSHA